MPMQINTSKLCWDLGSRTFTAEASELGLAPGADIKFLDIISEWTGQLVSVFCAGKEVDEDDVQAWHYIPVDKGFDFKLIVFND